MSEKNIIKRIREELQMHADINVKKSGERFFRESVKMYGIKTATVTKIAKKYFFEIKSLPKKEIWDLCEVLWQSGYMEESFIACQWSYSLHKDYTKGDFEIFEKWLKNHVTNWAACDTLCNHTVGTIVEMYPEYLSELKKWTRSKNRWVRRASAVTLVVPARNGKFLPEIFEIAELLLMDDDDMVQKGYGWMLKVASQAHQKEVFKYVMKNKKKMPRTALRYAIEKMPKDLKVRAMAK
jgi:3-methyladenine DNA glycosylase AlkD